ncbi:hypothetical protein TURU_014837 [Turdus rufiventris]|nr:hypothetical protein TURU_014837 [Turdus rufiventris]
MPSILSQQHTREMTARGDTRSLHDILPDNAGSAVTFLLPTGVDSWEPNAGGSEGASSNRIRGQSLKLHHQMFKLNIMKNFFMEPVVKHWNRLAKEVVDSPSLEVLMK